MKIFFYINKLGDGGAERVVTNLASGLAYYGYEVAIINSYFVDDEYIVSKAVRRFYLEEENIKYDNLIKRNIRRISRLRKIIKEEAPDILVSFLAEPNYRNLVSSIGLKTKSIISIRNDPKKEYNGWIGNFLARTLLLSADGCVFQTEDAKKWFPSQLQDKSRIIFNAVSSKFYQVIKSPNHFEIVSCGRLSKQKNYPMLFKAFSNVTSTIPKAILKVYGKGSEEYYLKNLVAKLGMQNNIFFMGHSRDMPTALSTASLFVISSDFEGMPNSLMEAMAVGLPCISTDCPCGGPKSLIIHEKNGLLIPVKDQKSMEKYILKCLLNDKYAEYLGKNARETAYMFRSDVIIKQWIDLFESLTDNSQKCMHNPGGKQE